ncbi:MAG: TonB-dependent receptor [Oceanicaulis sp.]|nr:TonB-dependent receptor [Oceanicaulis sp.]
MAFNDVSRVEVIKGPQGTLFGRNSAAGAISITSNAPSEDVEASWPCGWARTICGALKGW